MKRKIESLYGEIDKVIFSVNWNNTPIDLFRSTSTLTFKCSRCKPCATICEMKSESVGRNTLTETVVRVTKTSGHWILERGFRRLWACRIFRWKAGFRLETPPRSHGSRRYTRGFLRIHEMVTVDQQFCGSQRIRIHHLHGRQGCCCCSDHRGWSHGPCPSCHCCWLEKCRWESAAEDLPRNNSNFRTIHCQIIKVMYDDTSVNTSRHASNSDLSLVEAQREESWKRHDFQELSYHIRTHCDDCGKKLSDMIRPTPAFECKNCHFKTHKEHVSQGTIPMCRCNFNVFYTSSKCPFFSYGSLSRAGSDGVSARNLHQMGFAAPSLHRVNPAGKHIRFASFVPQTPRRSRFLHFFFHSSVVTARFLWFVLPHPLYFVLFQFLSIIDFFSLLCFICQLLVSIWFRFVPFQSATPLSLPCFILFFADCSSTSQGSILLLFSP